MKKILGAIALTLLFTASAQAAPANPLLDPLPMSRPILPLIGAQTAGFVSIGSVAAGVTSFVDSSNCKDGLTCDYEVTAFNAVGESGPSNIVALTFPATGTHTATISWTPATTGGAPAGYNIYFLAGPAPPTATGTVN